MNSIVKLIGSIVGVYIVFNLVFVGFKNNKKILLSVREITSKKYVKEYKKRLFCATNGCHARLCFVAKSGNKNYLRTWRNSIHSPHCLYSFNKVDGGRGNRKVGTLIGIVSGDQIRKSLIEAYDMENMSEDEKWKLAEEKRQKAVKGQRPKVNETSEQMTLAIVSDPSRLTPEAYKNKGRLYKRDVDTLRETDDGQTRTVTGRIYSLNYMDGIPIIRVFKNDIFMNVRFEEAFFANAEQYYDMFKFVDRLLKDVESAILNATGEVRRVKENNEFELLVFDREDLLIEGMPLPSLVSYYTTEQLSF